MSKIQQELAAATEVNPKRGESIDDADYKKRLCRAVGELADKDWNKLSSKAQDWFNETVDLVNAKKEPGDWPDAEKQQEEEKPATRRRAAADADEKKDAEPAKPKKGDTVNVTTRRGKEYSGVVVDPDDNGELVINDGKEELGISLTSIETLKIVGDEKPEAGSRRRKAAEEDEGPAEPAVGDTVQLTTKRGKVVMGNIVEIDDKIVVLKTTSGDEEEFDKDRVESLVVKAKNSGAAKDPAAGDEEEKPTSRRGGSDKKDDAGEKGKRVAKSENGGVSVGTRARELMCDDPKISKEDLMKALKKEGLEFKDSTIGMIHADCCKLFEMLRTRKMLKA